MLKHACWILALRITPNCMLPSTVHEVHFPSTVFIFQSAISVWDDKEGDATTQRRKPGSNQERDLIALRWLIGVRIEDSSEDLCSDGGASLAASRDEAHRLSTDRSWEGLRCYNDDRAAKCQ